MDRSNPGTASSKTRHKRSNPLFYLARMTVTIKVTCESLSGSKWGRISIRTLAISAYQGRLRPGGHKPSKPIVILIASKSMRGSRKRPDVFCNLS